MIGAESGEKLRKVQFEIMKSKSRFLIQMQPSTFHNFSDPKACF